MKVAVYDAIKADSLQTLNRFHTIIGISMKGKHTQTIRGMSVKKYSNHVKMLREFMYTSVSTALLILMHSLLFISSFGGI